MKPGYLSMKASALGTAILILSSGVAPAAAPPEVSSCAACHGAGGLGNAAAGFPALAGLPSNYIQQQLFSFKHGARQNAIMTGIAAPLTADQRKAIGDYYAAQPVPARPEPSPFPTGPGAALATNGDWDHSLSGIPGCNSCHGPAGIGVGTAFPRLAGLPKAYIAAQLAAWQKGTRENDPQHLMQTIARKLSTAQIDAVAAYYASLSANPTRLPGETEPEGAK